MKLIKTTDEIRLVEFTRAEFASLSEIVRKASEYYSDLEFIMTDEETIDELESDFDKILSDPEIDALIDAAFADETDEEDEQE